MPKRGPVHFTYPESTDVSICQKLVGDSKSSGSTNWKEVTCKDCRKYSPDRKGK